jgi:hypothetical protein
MSERSEAARAFLARLGVRQAERPVRATNTRPPRAREVSREEFERVRRGGSVSGIDDVEIGEARMEEPIDSAQFSRRPSGAAPSTTRDADLAMALDSGRRPDRSAWGAAAELAPEPIPPAWVRGGASIESPESVQRRERERTAGTERDRARAAAYRRAPVTEGLAGDIMGLSDESEAMAEGATQGVSLGFADEAGGAFNAATGDQSYGEARDEIRQRAARLRAENPGAYGVGEITGSLLPALALPGANARSVGGRVFQAGGMGAGVGSVQGYGTSEADTLSGQARDTARGGAYGFGFGAGGQLIGEGASAMFNANRVVDGAPVGGRDFTPEQQAAIDADPGLSDMARQRARVERRAANQRVAATLPDEDVAGLERIGAEYDDGIRGLARDLDESGIAPRRTRPTTTQVQRRAEAAMRPAAEPRVAGIDDEALPPGVRPGQFPDDEAAAGLPRSGERPPMGPARNQIGPDPEVRRPFDPARTEEARLRALQAEDPEGWASALREDEARRAAGYRPLGEGPERIGPAPSTEGATPRPGARGRVRGASAEPRVEGIDAERPARDAVILGPDDVADDVADDAPIDFSEGMMAGDTPRSPRPPMTEEHRAQQRANILAAERRERRGGQSFATHDERTWPVDLAQTREVPPAPPPTPAQPPPLPRRAAPEPAQAPQAQRPQVDLGRWDAPDVQPPAPPVGRTPGQRAGEVVTRSAREGELARDLRPLGGEGSLTERARAVASEWARMPQQRAAANEIQSDMLANEIVAQLQRNAGTRTFGSMLDRELQRGYRSYGLALMTLMNRNPEVANVVGQTIAEYDASPYVTPRRRAELARQPSVQRGGSAITDTADAPDTAAADDWSTPYRPRRRE